MPHWPPTAKHMDMKTMKDFVPVYLFNVIVWCCGLSEEPVTEEKIVINETHRLKVLSICQDIISLANNGTLASKNVALGNFVRHTTGSLLVSLTG